MTQVRGRQVWAWGKSLAVLCQQRAGGRLYSPCPPCAPQQHKIFKLLNQKR